MTTTIGIDEEDLPRFNQLLILYSAQVNRRVSQSEYFKKMLEDQMNSNKI